MKRFQYHILKHRMKGGWFEVAGSLRDEKLTAEINQLGCEGWELVSTLATNYEGGEPIEAVLFFKREILGL